VIVVALEGKLQGVVLAVALRLARGGHGRDVPLRRDGDSILGNL
jgi:hypothetical protein